MFQYFNFLMCLSHQLLRGNNIDNAQPPTDSTKRDFVLKCSSSCRLKILVICLGEYGEEIKEYLDLCLLEFSFTDTLLDRKTDQIQVEIKISNCQKVLTVFTHVFFKKVCCGFFPVPALNRFTDLQQTYTYMLLSMYLYDCNRLKS